MRRRAVVILCCLLVLIGGCRRKRRRDTQEHAAVAASPMAPSATPVQTTDSSVPPGWSEPAASEIGVGDITYEKRLLRGFYESKGGYRWSGRTFAVAVDPPQPLARTFLELDFGIPSELINEVKSVTVVGRIEHREIVRRTYTRTGREFLSGEVPLKLLKKTPTVVEVELDKAAKDPDNGRELGLTVVGVNLKHYEDSAVGRDIEAQRSREGYKFLLEKRRLLMPLDKQKRAHEVVSSVAHLDPDALPWCPDREKPIGSVDVSGDY